MTLDETLNEIFLKLADLTIEDSLKDEFSRLKEENNKLQLELNGTVKEFDKMPGKTVQFLNEYLDHPITIDQFVHTPAGKSEKKIYNEKLFKSSLEKIAKKDLSKVDRVISSIEKLRDETFKIRLIDAQVLIGMGKLVLDCDNWLTRVLNKSNSLLGEDLKSEISGVLKYNKHIIDNFNAIVESSDTENISRERVSQILLDRSGEQAIPYCKGALLLLASIEQI